MTYSAFETVLMSTHGLVGTCVVLSGGCAILSRKGSNFHRKSGKVFAVALCLMAAVILTTGLLAARLVSTLGITYTALACYLVLTSWATVRSPPGRLDRFSYIAPALACSIGMVALYWGFSAALGYVEIDDDIPVAAYFGFGGLAFLMAWGDILVILKGGLVGGQRLARHLWRMCFVFYLSTATLFTGPGSVVFPEGIRGSWPLMLPELSVLVLSLYWLTKILRPQTFRNK